MWATSGLCLPDHPPVKEKASQHPCLSVLPVLISICANVMGRMGQREINNSPCCLVLALANVPGGDG